MINAKLDDNQATLPLASTGHSLFGPYGAHLTNYTKPVPVIQAISAPSRRIG